MTVRLRDGDVKDDGTMYCNDYRKKMARGGAPKRGAKGGPKGGPKEGFMKILIQTCSLRKKG